MINGKELEPFEIKIGPFPDCGAIWFMFDFHPNGIVRGIGYQSEKGVTQEQVDAVLGYLMPAVSGLNRSEIVELYGSAIAFMAAAPN